MLPFVLGGIAAAAAGFAAREFYKDDEVSVCFTDKDDSAKGSEPSPKSTAEHSPEISIEALHALLRNIEGYQAGVALLCQRNIHDALSSCVSLLQEAHEAGVFYLRQMERMHHKSTQTLSAVESKLITYAKRYVQHTQTFLLQVPIVQEGHLAPEFFKACFMYQNELTRHQEKIRLFQCYKENYTLFLTVVDK